MAIAGNNLVTTTMDLSEVTCAFCMDVFENPHRASCGHTFCRRCLDQFLGVASPVCPVCRQTFDVRTFQRNDQVERYLSTTYTQCNGCKTQVLLSEYRGHVSACDRVKAIEKETIERKKITSPVVDGPNRHTFQCPFCRVAHLDQTGLVKHCNEKHSNSRQQVVCPVCASMPWGDPNLKSANFIQHLNARHKFEYDTYVDYQQDDDAMLRAALAASLAE